MNKSKSPTQDKKSFTRHELEVEIQSLENTIVNAYVLNKFLIGVIHTHSNLDWMYIRTMETNNEHLIWEYYNFCYALFGVNLTDGYDVMDASVKMKVNQDFTQ